VGAPLVVVGGTGTGVGKTHVACALLRAWCAERPGVVGWKPVETGASTPPGPDQAALAAAGAFHVKPSATYPDPVSPHLAARRAGARIDVEELVRHAQELRREAPGVVLELAGGLFSPLTDDLLNADFASRLAPTVLLLVAPDRLGVLHDVLATTRAARAAGLAPSGVLLSAPEAPDASTGTNADELAWFTDLPVLAALPRAPADELAPRLKPLLRRLDL
jgi:dethiobiotin synthetase